MHVLAATVWVGGQLTLAGLVPSLRRSVPSAVPIAARAFARLAWPSFVVLVGTGIWNVAAAQPAHQSAAWRAVLYVKVAVALLSGVGAYMHQRARRGTAIAVWGAVAGVTAPAAVVLGVLLAG